MPATHGDVGARALADLRRRGRSPRRATPSEISRKREVVAGAVADGVAGADGRWGRGVLQERHQRDGDEADQRDDAPWTGRGVSRPRRPTAAADDQRDDAAEGEADGRLPVSRPQVRWLWRETTVPSSSWWWPRPSPRAVVRRARRRRGLLEGDGGLDVGLADGVGDEEGGEAGEEADEQPPDEKGACGHEGSVRQGGAAQGTAGSAGPGVHREEVAAERPGLSGRGSRAGGVRRGPTRGSRCRRERDRALVGADEEEHEQRRAGRRTAPRGRARRSGIEGISTGPGTGAAGDCDMVSSSGMRASLFDGVDADLRV